MSTLMTATALQTGRPVAGAVGLGGALWTVLAALPWLVPTHSEPWTTFYSEALMAVAMLSLAAWAVLRFRERWPVDVVTAGLVCLAAVPLVQAAAGLFVFPTESWLIALYLSGMAMTFALGQHLQRVAPGRFLTLLFASFAIAGLLSVAIAMYQWLALDGLGLWIASDAPGSRPRAHVGQPNNLATLLAWALVAFYWAFRRESIGGTVAFLAAAFVLFGIALTQSRTGWLAVLLLFSTCFLTPLGTQKKRAQSVAALVALAAWFVICVLAQQPMAELTGTAVPLSLVDHANPGKRPSIWSMTLQAIAARPWFGYGWNQSVLGHVELAPAYPHLHTVVGHAHNLLLDLMMWNGLPLATIVILATGCWGWWHLSAPPSIDRSASLLVLGVLCLHAMLELPHLYAFFLLPAAAVAGILAATRSLPPLAWAPRPVPALLVAALFALVLTAFLDYRRIEDNAVAHGLKKARIGHSKPPVPADARFLSALDSALDQIRRPASPEISVAELQRWRCAIGRYPTSGALYRYAVASTVNNRQDEAAWALTRLCALHPARVCHDVALDWEAAVQGPYIPRE